MWKQDLGGIPLAKILLEMKNITKTFPGVKALDNVNLQVEEGEIHALVGENGAGKSTLMNAVFIRTDLMKAISSIMVRSANSTRSRTVRKKVSLLFIRNLR